VESKLIQNIGLCTGAAQGMITQAVSLELDAYLSGEISEPTVHIANETGVNYFSAGHHATERGGVMALGKHLKAQFKIDFEFKDLYNPV
jgi:putative NIF3 family GTP cyclohydrolase 1 type 2